jgi:hypothetical protein
MRCQQKRVRIPAVQTLRFNQPLPRGSGLTRRSESVQVSRPISTSEAAVLRRALEVGAVRAVAPEVLSAIDTLQVTAGCKCGCATVWFGPTGDATVGQHLAGALATSDGQSIEVLVWSIGEAIVGLELVGHGAVALPDSTSVRSYADA